MFHLSIFKASTPFGQKPFVRQAIGQLHSVQREMGVTYDLGKQIFLAKKSICQTVFRSNVFQQNISKMSFDQMSVSQVNDD